jgi:geranylgeranyl pyrophosphate synthase
MQAKPAPHSPLSAPQPSLASSLLPHDLVKPDLIAAVESQMLSLLAVDHVGAALYHIKTGGQRVRARLGLHASLALGQPTDDAVTLATACELLHNASLVHDDLQDRDSKRRGRPTVWAIYGDNIAICAGDLLLASAYRALSAYSDCRRLPELLMLAFDRTAAAIEGQCDDLSSLINSHDLADYEKIATAKSGALLSLPIELALVASGRTDLTALARSAAEAFAIAYQIVDDLADIGPDPAKCPGSDSFNIVTVLQRDGLAAGAARSAARGIGLQRADVAIVAADALPNNIGAILKALALSLQLSLAGETELGAA